MRHVLLSAVCCGLLTAACSGAHSTTTPAPTTARLAKVTYIRAEQLPPRLKVLYAGLMLEPQGSHPYAHYRVGDWKAPLAAYGQGTEAVYVDPAGGGMAFSQSCPALDTWKTAARWTEASSCSGFR